MVLFFSLLPIVIPHRSLFHDLGFVGALVGVGTLALIYFVPGKAASIISTSLFFLLGVISHLVMDKGFKKTFYHWRDPHVAGLLIITVSYYLSWAYAAGA